MTIVSLTVCAAKLFPLEDRRQGTGYRYRLMMIAAVNPISFELPHALMLIWLLIGALAIWLAKRFHLPRYQSVSIFLPMALGLVIFATYVTTRFNYDFLIDDIDIVRNNPNVVEADGWRTLWGSDYWYGQSTDDNLYRPVTTLSYWINARLPRCGTIVDGRATEMFPRYFRGANIVLLTALAWLIAVWLSHYVQLTAAWIVAFLFALHAAHGEMVNYIVCRADLLTMLGIVGFLYMQRLAIEQGRWRWWHGALAMLSAIVAFGSKETGLILIPAAATQAWIGPRHANTEVTDDLPVIPRSVHAGWLLLLLLPLGLWLAARFAVVGTGLDYTAQFMDDLRDNPLRRVTLLERLPAAFAIAWFYFSQIFSPDTAYYHLPTELPTFASREAILGVTLVTVLTLTLIHTIRRHRWVAIGIVIAMGQYLIVGNLLMPVGVYAANRLMPPFSLGAAIIVAGGLHRFCRHSTRRRAVAILPSLAALILMAVQIQNVNHVWRTEARLMGHDLMLKPGHPVALYNFGTVRAREATLADRHIRALTHALDMVSLANRTVHSSEPLSKSDRAKITDTLERLRAEMTILHEGIMNLEQTQALRDVVALVDRTLLKDGPALTAQDLTDAEKKLNLALEENLRLSAQYWSESMAMLGQVVTLRPQSLSGSLEFGRAMELRGMKAQARDQYRDLVNKAADDTDLRVIEARVRYAKLSIDLSLDPAGAERSVLIVAKLLDVILHENATLAPGLRNDLVALHRNALRYHGIIAWKVGDIPLALRRHGELLLKYPDFDEARTDQAQWIDQLTPHDARRDDPRQPAVHGAPQR